MGTLAGVALRLRELGQGNLHVINLNERNRDLLSNLGLDQLFAIDMCAVKSGDTPTQPLADVPAAGNDRTAQAETMLQAHQALVEADPENLMKFKDVLEYLKQDLRLAE